jgi:hypothetical protein
MDVILAVLVAGCVIIGVVGGVAVHYYLEAIRYYRNP